MLGHLSLDDAHVSWRPWPLYMCTWDPPPQRLPLDPDAPPPSGDNAGRLPGSAECNGWGEKGWRMCLCYGWVSSGPSLCCPLFPRLPTPPLPTASHGGWLRVSASRAPCTCSTDKGRTITTCLSTKDSWGLLKSLNHPL